VAVLLVSEIEKFEACSTGLPAVQLAPANAAKRAALLWARAKRRRFQPGPIHMYALHNLMTTPFQTALCGELVQQVQDSIKLNALAGSG